MASWALTEWGTNCVDKVPAETKGVMTNGLIVVLGNGGGRYQSLHSGDQWQDLREVLRLA